MDEQINMDEYIQNIEEEKINNIEKSFSIVDYLMDSEEDVIQKIVLRVLNEFKTTDEYREKYSRKSNRELLGLMDDLVWIVYEQLEYEIHLLYKEIEADEERIKELESKPYFDYNNYDKAKEWRRDITLTEQKISRYRGLLKELTEGKTR